MKLKDIYKLKLYQFSLCYHYGTLYIFCAAKNKRQAINMFQQNIYKNNYGCGKAGVTNEDVSLIRTKLDIRGKEQIITQIDNEE